MEEKVITQKEIHDKGFNIVQSGVNDYAKIKIGTKAYDDATIDFYLYEKLKRRRYYNKEEVIRALAENDIATLRDISEYFYRTDGIY